MELGSHCLCAVSHGLCRFPPGYQGSSYLPKHSSECTGSKWIISMNEWMCVWVVHTGIQSRVCTRLRLSVPGRGSGFTVTPTRDKELTESQRSSEKLVRLPARSERFKSAELTNLWGSFKRRGGLVERKYIIHEYIISKWFCHKYSFDQSWLCLVYYTVVFFFLSIFCLENKILSIFSVFLKYFH